MITTFNWLAERTVVAIAWAILSGFVWAIVTIYLAREIGASTPAAPWSARRGNIAAVTIWIYMLGELISRTWGAGLTIIFRAGGDIGVVENRYPVGLFGAGVALVGALAMIRTFTPDGWGESVWIGAGLFSVAAAILIAAIAGA